MTQRETVTAILHFYHTLVEFPATLTSQEISDYMNEFDDLTPLTTTQINSVGRDNDELELYYPDIIAVYLGASQWQIKLKRMI